MQCYLISELPQFRYKLSWIRFSGNHYRYRICREVVDQIAEGELPANWQSLDTAYNSAGEKNTRLDDYNVVVLAAGTNDYLDNSTLGDLDSDDVSEFHGALNHIMEQILNASLERIQRGEDAINIMKKKGIIGM